ncbi:hypothetical protein MF271_03505 [Deinococcus sp. KNUC1210]|uniref:hypothetical protein n=1 Tax=Deinococcus sp. KNUC1210 TaxID=2917691 RepID=UPI001EF02682|nr:hypothetical protein [Deinococcus sp. KNUC1210]ULH15717.1 hypothetical protein MF271_03505 [Deinococcus sp. KNUC1210]
MKKLLVAPLLLVACAPALSNAPKPAPGQVIVRAVSTLPSSAGLPPQSPEHEAGIVGFASLSALLLVQSRYDTGLPSTYDAFSFPDGSKSMTPLSGKGDPVAVAIEWQARQKDGTNVVNVHWESRPLGGLFLGITVKASSTDAAVNTRAIEDKLLNRFYAFDGITFVASGR